MLPLVNELKVSRAYERQVKVNQLWDKTTEDAARKSHMRNGTWEKKTFLIAGNNEIENKIEKKVWELHKERGEKNSHLAQIATNYLGSAFC